MPNAKRASMREGPLSALFRKTTSDTGAAPHPSLEPAAPREPGGSGEPGEPVEAASEALDLSPEAPRPPDVPSPQERLRSAFSADIPASLMEPPAVEPAAPTEPAAAKQPVAAAEPVAEQLADVYASVDRSFEPMPVLLPAGQPVLRVVGVGGAGVNAVNRMIEAGIEGVEFIAINTDVQSLQTSAATTTLHIGDTVTRGLGSGSDPELGRQAAKDAYDAIKAMLRGSDMVFIAAGAGGGTGTGAAPVVAQIAREIGALTVGIVTRPFQFEGTRRRDQAESGIEALGESVDTLIVVPNNRLLTVLDRHTTMVEAFRVADDVLRQAVQGISDLVTLPGLINLDFADVRTIMSDAGNALLGIGMGTGENRAIEAAEAAVSSPLLETSMDGARSILLSITGGTNISLWEVNEAAKAVASAAHPEANIIFGAMVDERIAGDEVWITVIATGYDERGSELPARARDRATDATRLTEPDGEPRITRASGSASRFAVETDIPEFMPRR